MLKLGCSCKCIGYVIRNLYVIFHDFRRLPLSYSISTISSSSINEGNNNNNNNTCSFATFLVDSLGFSNHQSISTSAKLLKLRNKCDSMKQVNFNFVDNAEFVIHLFQQLGFQQSDIRRIVCYEPRILIMSRVSLQSKIDILHELGIFGSHLVQLVAMNPEIIYQNLGPAIHAFRVVLGSDDKVVRVLWRMNKICLSSVAYYLIPNTQLWQDYCGISSDRIKKYVVLKPTPFCLRTDHFRDVLIRVEQRLGIPRHSTMFIYGIQLLSGCSEKNFEDKCAIFKSFGWTQADIMELIRRNPVCLMYSEARIKKRLDFLSNQLGYKSKDLAVHPLYFICSLEMRLLPRHRVLQVLKEKGLLQRNCSLYSAISFTEAHFIGKYVLPFKEVHEVYAQLTSSTVDSLKVGRAKASPKVRLDSDAG